MKRCFTRLVVFLLLGAVVNVGVAWGFAALGRHKLHSLSGISFVNPEWERSIPVPHGMEVQFSGEEGIGKPQSYTLGLDAMLIYGNLLTSSGRWVGYGTEALRAGWPRRTLAGEYWELLDDNPKDDALAHFKSNVLVIESSVSKRLASPDGFGGGGGFGPRPFYLGRELPLRPLWPGFAINTIFYAVILWLLAFGPFAARRFIRDKRGRCVKCGYDLRGTSGGGGGSGGGCSECGWGRAEKIGA